MRWNYYSTPKLKRLHRRSLGIEMLFHATLYNGRNDLSILVLKLIHVSKMGLCWWNHCGLVPPYWGIDLGHHWIGWWLVARGHQVIDKTHWHLAEGCYTEYVLDIIRNKVFEYYKLGHTASFRRGQWVNNSFRPHNDAVSTFFKDNRLQ